LVRAEAQRTQRGRARQRASRR